MVTTTKLLHFGNVYFNADELLYARRFGTPDKTTGRVPQDVGGLHLGFESGEITVHAGDDGFVELAAWLDSRSGP